MNRSRLGFGFGFIDALRVIGGILLLNALLSYWFTSDTTWGYHGKYLNWRFLKHQLFESDLQLTLSELATYDGRHGQILLAINGSVYDVSANPSVYGPQGAYHGLVGKDAARVYVTGCFSKKDEYTHDLRGLDRDECQQDISGWQHFFNSHRDYWHVGTVELSYDGFPADPPAPCQHVKFPH